MTVYHLHCPARRDINIPVMAEKPEESFKCGLGRVKMFECPLCRTAVFVAVKEGE